MAQAKQSKMKVSKTREFAKEELEKFLGLLNDELCLRGITGELCVVGGAAMVLAFGSRASTRDIDALVLAPSSVRDAARKVAEEHGLPPSWLNDGVKGFAADHPLEAKELMKLSNLRVVAPSPEYILAMKCVSARLGVDEHDREDAKFLIKHLGLRDAGSAVAVVEKYYKASRIPAKTQYFIQDICNELYPKTQDIS